MVCRASKKSLIQLIYPLSIFLILTFIYCIFLARGIFFTLLHNFSTVRSKENFLYLYIIWSSADNLLWHICSGIFPHYVTLYKRDDNPVGTHPVSIFTSKIWFSKAENALSLCFYCVSGHRSACHSPYFGLLLSKLSLYLSNRFSYSSLHSNTSISKRIFLYLFTWFLYLFPCFGLAKILAPICLGFLLYTSRLGFKSVGFMVSASTLAFYSCTSRLNKPSMSYTKILQEI